MLVIGWPDSNDHTWLKEENKRKRRGEREKAEQGNWMSGFLQKFGCAGYRSRCWDLMQSLCQGLRMGGKAHQSSCMFILQRGKETKSIAWSWGVYGVLCSILLFLLLEKCQQAHGADWLSRLDFVFWSLRDDNRPHRSVSSEVPIKP